MRKIACDFPHANCIVLSAAACWQAVADRTRLSEVDELSKMLMRKISAQYRAKIGKHQVGSSLNENRK
jgi:hypothetical protein